MTKNSFEHLLRGRVPTVAQTNRAGGPFAHLLGGALSSGAHQHTEGLTPAAAAIIAMGERIYAVEKESVHG